jgi:hypothetical protein
MLRYEDPDGDMISFNADDELKEALRLCRGGTTLKMTLTAAQGSVQQEEPSVDACALSNVFEENLFSSSESGDFEIVETYSRPSSVSVATDRTIPEHRGRCSPTVQPSEMLRDRPADEQDDALEAVVMASIEEEHARVAREARDAAEFDALQAADMAFIEEDALGAGKRKLYELRLWPRRIAAEDAEEKARLEIAFAAAEEDALRRANELFSMGCSVDQIRSLYGQSILAKVRPRYWGIAAPAVSAVSEEGYDSDSSLPELVALYSSEDDSEDDEPVPASPFSFSHEHPEGLHMNGHECPFIAVLESDNARSEMAVEDEPPMSEETQNAGAYLESMGFTHRAKNLELLQKHNNNIERVVNELFA